MLDDENNKDDDLAKNNDAQDDEVMWLGCYLLGKFLYHMPKNWKTEEPDVKVPVVQM